MKSPKKGSVITRMYLGFAVLAGSLIATNSINLLGSEEIHTQLNTVASEAVPLVSYSNQTSVSLLSADKIFKDYLTSNDSDRANQVLENFQAAQVNFEKASEKLQQSASVIPELDERFTQLNEIKERYFAEVQLAIENVNVQRETERKVAKARRDFQRQQSALTIGMKELIAEKGSTTLKIISRTYFKKLAETEAQTSDALASDDLEFIAKAMKKNFRSTKQLSSSFRSLSSQLPELKKTFQADVDKFIIDVSKDGGVLQQHQSYLLSSQRLNQNITNLARDVDSAMILLDDFRTSANTVMTNSIASADKAFTNGVKNTLLIGSVVLIMSILIGWNISRSVRLPLNQLLKTLDALTKGDMTQRVTVKERNEFGELGDYINSLTSHLRDILTQIRDTAESQTEVAAQNQTTTQTAKYQLNEQRQQTTAVAAAMTQMDHSVKDVANSANQTKEKVKEVSDAATKGRLVMTKNITTTHQLSERLDDSVNVVSSLKEMSANIGSILDVISNIADQTNLLALNAAIEAARAGEQGRGFAVVADEVRVLAKRTSDATSEIESMINQLQTESQQAVVVMQECVDEMNNSVNQASDANSAMEEIEAIILNISDMSSQIVLAANEQATTSEEIARNIEHISEISNISFEAMQTVSDTSDMLDQQANNQSELVHKFTV
ncbi:methyl-accepting chemotaxis protein [Veronia nyctiphanis]|uniref:Methyl-accepting chemotaxis protein n=1 Tax=Veronia nyctiphanis TaxID=1278244 RepID=A0A4Q0YN98_9GAMM|nr:methyl-accepting chemotaxis protein [Veronia nyctiphanis]RXJ72417.1 methyl-accepting chemotaxis protein [Veronia nyctiphanis]